MRNASSRCFDVRRHQLGMTDQGFQCGKDMINPPETESECVCAFQDPRSNWGCGSSEASSRIEKWLTPREAPARCRRRAPIPAHPRTKLPESQSKRFPFLDRRGQREAGIRTPRITRFAATTSVSLKIKLWFSEFKIVIYETRRGEKVRTKLPKKS